MAAFGAIASAYGAGLERPPLFATAVLAVVALIVERRRVAVRGRLSASASYLPIVLAVVIGGAAAGAAVAACGMLAHFSAPYARWFVWTCTNVAAAAFAGAAVRLGGLGHALSVQKVGAASVIAGGFVVLVSLLLASLTLLIRKGPWRETLRAGLTLAFTSMAVYVPIVAMLAFGYGRLSVWLLIAVFPPVVAAQQLLVLYQQERDASARLGVAVDEANAMNAELEAANAALASMNRELEEVNLRFAASLIVSLDARDHYTAGHSAAVAVYSRDIARDLGLHDDLQALAYLAGLMHDIGKVGLPPGILEKAAPLTEEEEVLMQRHVLIGERIVSPVPQLRAVAPAVRHHHERFDGTGYPDGLAGDAIPILARIVGVADTYNAMTSDRPYRGAISPDIAIAELHRLAGSQLDPQVAAALRQRLLTEDASYRVARRAEFVIDFGRLSDGDSIPMLLRAVN